MELLVTKKNTYAELREVLNKFNLLGTDKPSADKRFQEFTRQVFQKKAFFVLLDNSIKMLKRLFDDEQIVVKFFIKEEVEDGIELNVFLETINGKTTAETPMEKLLLENVLETVKALDLELLIEGSITKIRELFEQADTFYFEKCKLKGQKANFEEALNHYLLYIFKKDAFVIEEELIESKNKRTI